MRKAFLLLLLALTALGAVLFPSPRSARASGVDLIHAETNDPPGTVDPNGTKDIASCTATLVSDNEVSIVIENGYPGYECTFSTVIQNNGTLPIRQEPLQFEVSPGLFVEELTDLTGLILDPGEVDEEKFIVRIEKDAPMDAKLAFEIRKPFSLFTEGSALQLVSINGSVAAPPAQQLAEKFAPRLWLANGDYQPEQVEIMFHQDAQLGCTTELRHHVSGGADFPVSPNCPTAQLLEAQPGADNYLDITGINVGQENSYNQRYNNISGLYFPVTYAYVRVTGGEVLIDYWLFYYYQPWWNVDHEGDWERIRVRVAGNSIEEALSASKPQAVGLSRHACDGGNGSLSQPLVEKNWTDDELQSDDETHPVIYVARGSHANYFDTGILNSHSPVSACAAFHDRTFADVPVDPTVVLIDCSRFSPAWVRYRGRWGQWGPWPGGPEGPCRGHHLLPGTDALFLATIPPSQQAAFSSTWQASDGVTTAASPSAGSSLGTLQSSDVVMTLTSPSGRVIDRSTVAPDVVHELGLTFETYTITNPEPGDWQVSLFGADVPLAGEEVAFSMTSVPADQDADGCTDSQELAATAASGGLRDPLNHWDFFDTPDPANARDKIISTGDIFRIVLRFGSTGDPGGDPLSQPPLSPAYHTAFDRSPPQPGADAWDLGPPDGSISVGDIFFEVNQFGHTCA